MNKRILIWFKVERKWWRLRRKSACHRTNQHFYNKVLCGWNKEWKNAHRKQERKKIESGEEKETEKQWPLVPLLCGWRLIIHIKLCHYAWSDDFFRIFFTRSLARALCSHAFRFSCAVSSSFHRQFYYDLFCIECVCVWRTGFATCISNCCRSFSGFSCFAFWS